MNVNISDNDKRNLEMLIGILLIIPIYMIAFVLLDFLGLNNGDNSILFPTLMYLPVIIGVALSYKNYKNGISKPIMYLIFAFCLISIYFYYNTYFVEYEGWDGLGQYFLWLINTIIVKILSCVLYGKIVGWKRALIFLGIYILLVLFSVVLGFWA